MINCLADRAGEEMRRGESDGLCGCSWRDVVRFWWTHEQADGLRRLNVLFGLWFHRILPTLRHGFPFCPVGGGITLRPRGSLVQPATYQLETPRGGSDQSESVTILTDSFQRRFTFPQIDRW